MASTAQRQGEPPIVLEGALIEGFRVGRKLGAGGVGAVYEGTAEASGRRVAIKVLHREFSDHRDVTLRFFNELRQAQSRRSTAELSRPGMGREWRAGLGLSS
jgi:serine/threonine protein kinase